MARQLRAETEGTSSVTGDDPQSGDTTTGKKLLEMYYFDEIMMIIPYACTDIHNEDSREAQNFHMRVSDAVRNNHLQLPYEAEGKDSIAAIYLLTDRLLQLPTNASPTTVIRGYSTWHNEAKNAKGKGKGGHKGAGDKGGGKPTKKGQWQKGKGQWQKGKGGKWKGKGNWHKGGDKGKGGGKWSWQQECDNWSWGGQESNKGDLSNKRPRDPAPEEEKDPKKQKTSFQMMQERLVKEVHNVTKIPEKKISDAWKAKDYCPVYGAEITKVKGKNNTCYACTRKKDCWHSHEGTEKFIKAESDWCPEAK
eukprot:g3950.t1